MEQEELTPKPASLPMKPPDEQPSVVETVFNDDEEKAVIENIVDMAKSKDKRGRHTIMAAKELMAWKHGKGGVTNMTVQMNIDAYAGKRVEVKSEPLPPEEGEWEDA